jgi:hypothetical protein
MYYMVLKLFRMMPKIFRILTKFIITLIVMIIVCTMAWDSFVNNKIYNCTDGGALDFWFPGDWVHSHDGLPIMIVNHIVAGRSMNEPDTIKAGWSPTGLWCLWYTFVLVSIVVSILSARKSWTT